MSGMHSMKDLHEFKDYRAELPPAGHAAWLGHSFRLLRGYEQSIGPLVPGRGILYVTKTGLSSSYLSICAQ
jgi:hypothetical protein